MPLKGEQNREYMREYMRRRRAAGRKGEPRPKAATAKPVDDRSAALEAEVAALKAELARERKQREAAPARGDDDDEAPASGPVGRKVFKLLLKLDDDNDNTVLVAARKLVSALKTNGSDLRVLADAMGAEWEKQHKAKPPPPPPIDWPKVDAAIKDYVADRTTVSINKVWNAVKRKVPALEEYRGPEAARHVKICLGRLGFAPNKSGLTWQRK